MTNDSVSVWGDEDTRHFHLLEPDKVLNISEKFGITCTGRVLQLNSMENRVFQVEVDNLELPVNDPLRYRIVKFYRPGRWSYEQIKEEHQFLQDLVESDYPVVAPFSFDNGETIYKDEETGLLVSMFPKIGGRNVDELTENQLPIVGRLLSRLHAVGRSSMHKHRLSLDIKTYGDSNLDLIISSGFLPLEFENTFVDLMEDILDLIEPMFEDIKTQRIHGDCHLGNLLDGANGLFWVDFDDTVNGPPVQDIWLIESARDDYSRKRLEILLDAYETFNSFDYSTLKLIEPLRTLRMIHFTAWIGKRYEDQSFKKAYPEYGTNSYWQEQIITFREQFELMSR